MKKRTTALPINLSEQQEKHLLKLAKGTHSKLHHKNRAQFLLLANEGLSNSAIARECGCAHKTCRKWRNRWYNATAELNYIETEFPHNLKSFIKHLLEDDYRPGKPPKFKPEQIASIISLACQKPDEDLRLPFTHWSNSLLAREAEKRNIVDSISPRQVGRYLEEIDLKPHRVHSWLNPKIEDKEIFEEQVIEVCDTYHNANMLENNGTHVYCTDEMTGIQALSHCSPNMPARPGHIERYEQEYKRNGTSGAIVSRSVVTGEIIAPLIQPKRKEDDFLKHIQNVIETDPESKFIFIMDQLNTHKSESLVNLVIDKCDLDIDKETIGKKGSSGILKSMNTRAEFLSDPSHNIQIIYTPKHCSWLNQIEIWFSILKRHLLNKRASFSSVEELEQRIKEYIDYYNENIAKPFVWTYTGKLLKA